jgi:hypothetical protein
VPEQPLPELGLDPDRTSLGGDLASPQQARAQNGGAQQQEEQDADLLEIRPFEKDPVHHLAQKDHLGDGGDGGQEPERHGEAQGGPRGPHLPEQLPIHPRHPVPYRPS